MGVWARGCCAKWSVQDNSIPGIQGTKKQRNGVLCSYPLVPGDPPRLVRGPSEAGGDSSHKGTKGTDEDSLLEGFAFAKCEHRFMENFGVLFPRPGLPIPCKKRSLLLGSLSVPAGVSWP